MKKVWVEIDRKAIKENIRTIRRRLKKGTKLFAVVKSNAYGHGLTQFSSIAEESGVDGFCVDSVVEGLKLRKNGIGRPILVLGPTLPFNSLREAQEANIAITVSTAEGLAKLAKTKNPPEFHLKIDTRMHRQGFQLPELPKAIRELTTHNLQLTTKLKGIYTHFASAKDLNYPTFTDFQFHAFKKAIKMFEAARLKNLIRHAAATGGTLISKEYHLDVVRIGIGLYGLWPSRELELQLSDVRFKPVLSWKALVSEVKTIPAGGYVGYDLVERVARPTKMAIIPIGYWHGFDRGLSGVGEVLIRGKRAKVLGRVSMDLIVVDVTGIPLRVGDVVTIIGRDKKETITAEEFAQKIGTSHYEVITRINPLIERVLV